MIKSISVIKKNFKLLIRSKTSAFTVLIGPLLIVLLVGLVFSGKSSYELSIGYYTPDYTELTNSFVESLEQSNYYVQEFKDEASCVRKIEQGVIHTCIIFPNDFKISDEEKNELNFLVDYSRMNLVYKIIDSVSGILEAESEELSYSLTQVLLSKINSTLEELESHSLLLEEANPKLNLLLLDLQKAKANAESMKLDTRGVSLRNIDTYASYINETVELMHENIVELINETEIWLEDALGESIEDLLEDENASYHYEAETFAELKNETLKLHNETNDDIERLMNSINSTSRSLARLESDLNESKELNEDVKSKLDSAKNNLAIIQANLLDLRDALTRSKQNLEDIQVRRAETIVSPVNTVIEPVVLETSKITFTFPFLLMLVIMFVALLLSSNLIMFEKTSKAFFRNFTTPTKPALFVITTFLTGFTVIVLQTIIILGLANFFLQIPLFKNAFSTLLIILAASTFFITLGMAVGYLFSTQEGAIMASIVLGALFMFLSNLVLPLESLAPIFSNIIKYNPYVLSSELLRKSLLFKVDTMEALTIILILFGASLVIFLLMLVLHGLVHRKKIKEPLEVEEPALIPKKTAPPQKKVKKGIRAESRTDLLEQISEMTRAEFEEMVNLKENRIADLVEKNIGDKKLAHKIRRTLSKKEIIKLLEEDIKRYEKRAKSKKEI